MRKQVSGRDKFVKVLCLPCLHIHNTTRHERLNDCTPQIWTEARVRERARSLEDLAWPSTSPFRREKGSSFAKKASRRKQAGRQALNLTERNPKPRAAEGKVVKKSAKE